MSYINFAQGNKENYNAEQMQDTIYLSGDSKEVLFNNQSYGNATPADEEDLTAESGNLKLKDRNYDEANFSGKGYVILRKNISEGKNILTQDRINKANTIYEIRYDFDLNGEEIIISDNCILDFQGGRIANGTIQLTNTRILPDGCNISDYITAIITGNYAVGQCLYDTNLNKPIYWNGSEWVTSEGLDTDSTGWALIE